MCVISASTRQRAVKHPTHISFSVATVQLCLVESIFLTEWDVCVIKQQRFSLHWQPARAAEAARLPCTPPLCSRRRGSSTLDATAGSSASQRLIYDPRKLPLPSLSPSQVDFADCLLLLSLVRLVAAAFPHLCRLIKAAFRGSNQPDERLVGPIAAGFWKVLSGF